MSNYLYPSAIDEKVRIDTLQEYQALNNNDKSEFSRLAELVKDFFNVSMVTISFMDEHT